MTAMGPAPLIRITHEIILLLLMPKKMFSYCLQMRRRIRMFIKLIVFFSMRYLCLNLHNTFKQCLKSTRNQIYVVSFKYK